jgi:DNA-binding response OmpR family regulator
MLLLLIEDDEVLGQLLRQVFGEEGIDVRWCKTVASGLAEATNPTDVIVLDWMLPDGDGIGFCKALRERDELTPVLMLTARGEVHDRVLGLKVGADDYLVKPFEVEELLARLQALTRRNRQVARLQSGDLLIDRLQRRCTLRGTPIELTARELDLLLRIAAGGGAPVTRMTLLRDVWRMSFDPGSGVLDVHISRLRDKLGEAAGMIETVRGVGYRWAERP